MTQSEISKFAKTAVLSIADTIRRCDHLEAQMEELKGLIIELCRVAECGHEDGEFFYAEPGKLLDKVTSMRTRLSLIP